MSETKTAELTEGQKFRMLIKTIGFLISGCRQGNISSKAGITIMEEDAEQWPVVSLEEYLLRELAAVGVTEKKN